jgi:hypothetical protein
MRSKGISSIYGFIMIFLLSMASLQVWSSAVGSLTEIQGASDQSHQLEQMQGLEHLALSASQGNLTVTNDGQVPSTIEFLRLVDQNDSSTVAVERQLAVGSSFEVPVKAGYTVEVVTALGNVFLLASSAGFPFSGLTVEQTDAGDSNTELFQNPYDPSMFFAGSGSEVSAFSAEGSRLWSFDAGQGFVTDVMPISGGDIYVSVGYQFGSNAATLYELSPGGGVMASYPVRLDQEVNGPAVSQAPVSKGEDAQDALYDGWFYSASGQATGVPSDDFPLAASDSSHFYFYQTLGVSLDQGVCSGGGDEIKLYSYTPALPSPTLTWTDYLYTEACDGYPPQILGATAGNGLVAGLFAETPYVAPGLTEYSGQNPYLVVTTTSGDVLYDGTMPTGGYSGSIATDGSNVYLALPQADEVQAVSGAGDTVKTYVLGFPASQLLWAYGSLFAISSDEVKVYGSGMSLEKTMVFAPLTISSFSNGFLSESSLHAASFLPINSTSYAALLENSTGYTSMVVGNYA